MRRGRRPDKTRNDVVNLSAARGNGRQSSLVTGTTPVHVIAMGVRCACTSMATELRRRNVNYNTCNHQFTRTPQKLYKVECPTLAENGSCVIGHRQAICGGRPRHCRPFPNSTATKQSSLSADGEPGRFTGVSNSSVPAAPFWSPFPPIVSSQKKHSMNLSTALLLLLYLAICCSSSHPTPVSIGVRFANHGTNWQPCCKIAC